MDILKTKSSSFKQIATPTVHFSALQTLTTVKQQLQSKLISPTMLQYCIGTECVGEGVFGICHKAYFQGMPVCVKELKDKDIHSSKSAILHEAQVLSKLCHPSLCWLIAVQIQSAPFQMVTPLYAVDNVSVTYHDILFNRDSRKFVPILHHISSYKDWVELLQDIAEGLKCLHKSGLVFRDLKEDNVVLYKTESAAGRIHAVLIDFGKCLPESSCKVYLLTEAEREMYRKKHRHICPELVNGEARPSPASDIYSFGRILKHTLLYATLELESWPKQLKETCKQTLKYSASVRPTTTDILSVILKCLS